VDSSLSAKQKITKSKKQKTKKTKTLFYFILEACMNQTTQKKIESATLMGLKKN
jgi:hypothetical protein